MEDYQIRDALRRETMAKPYVEFTLDDKLKDGTCLEQDLNGLFHFRLYAFASNRSNQPAFYSVVTLFISKCVSIISRASMSEVVTYDDESGNSYFALRKQYGIPQDFPLFKEAKIQISSPPITIGVDAPTKRDGSFPIGYEVMTPGYHVTEFGLVRCKYGRLKIDFPTEVSG
jgi:hypothetical protein